jgi:hypothetical protein
MPVLVLIEPCSEGLSAVYWNWAPAPSLTGSSGAAPVPIVFTTFCSFLLLLRCSLLFEILSLYLQLRYMSVLPQPSRVLLACRSASSFLGMPECPGVHRISVLVPWLCRRFLASLLIHRASYCQAWMSTKPSVGSQLKIDTFFVTCPCNLSPLLAISLSAIHITHNLASKTSLRPQPRKLRRGKEVRGHGRLCTPRPQSNYSTTMIATHILLGRKKV